MALISGCLFTQMLQLLGTPFPRPPAGALPLDPSGGLPSPRPPLAPPNSTFWIRPWTDRHRTTYVGRAYACIARQKTIQPTYRTPASCLGTYFFQSILSHSSTSAYSTAMQSTALLHQIRPLVGYITIRRTLLNQISHSNTKEHPNCQVASNENGSVNGDFWSFSRIGIRKW